MFRILLVTVAAASLLACSGSSAQLVAPATWQLECSQGQGDCFRQAHKVCPHGFDPIGGSSRTGYLLAGGVAMPASRDELIVRCHRPPEQ